MIQIELAIYRAYNVYILIYILPVVVIYPDIEMALARCVWLP